MQEQTYSQKMLTRRTLVFEDRIVSMICNSLGLTFYLSLLRKRAEDELGTRTLMLKHFNKWHPAFPLLLGVPQDARTLDFRANLLWSSVPKNPLYSAFFNHPDASVVFQRAGYFGLIFDGRCHLPMIMHNDFPRDRSGEMETRIEKTYGRRRIKFVIEPFKLFLNSIPPVWHQTAEKLHE